MSDNIKNARFNMWQMLAQAIITNIESSHLDKILVMIKNNLTYDDPGLFSSKVLKGDVERLREEATNIWLINQLIYVVNISNNQRPINNNVSLQIQIISACIMKQPWLFEKIIKKYIDFTSQLVQVEPCPQLNVEFNVFYIEDFPITSVDPNCSYRPIHIKNIEQRNRLIECNLKILTQAMSLSLDLDEDLFKQCNCCIRFAMDKMDFDVKLLCIEYTTKMINDSAHISTEFLSHIVFVLQASRVIVENIQLWMDNDLVTRSQIVNLNNQLVKLFKTLPSVALRKCTVNHRDALVEEALAILNIFIKENFANVEIYFLELRESIVKFFTLLCKHSNYDIGASRNKCYEFAESIEHLPNLTPILEDFIINEIIESPQNSSQTAVRLLSKTWKAIHDRCIESINGLNTARRHDLSKCLRLLLCVLKSVIAMNQNFTLWHQLKHFKSSGQCSVCEFSPSSVKVQRFIDKTQMKMVYPTFFDGNTFVSIVGKIVEFSISPPSAIPFEDVNSIMDIAAALLQTPNITDIDRNNQSILIDLICNPIAEVYQIKLQNQINIKVEETSSDCEQELQLKSLALLLSFDGHFQLNSENRNYHKILIQKICQSFYRSNSCTQKAFECILLNSVLHLALCGVVTSDFIQNVVLKNALADTSTFPVLGDLLSQLFCLVDSNTHVFKMTNDLIIKYNIVCNSCTIEPNLSPREEVGVKEAHKEYLLAMLSEQRGVYVSNYKSINFNESIFIEVFQALLPGKSSDVITCVPSLLNHIKCREAFEKWCELFSHQDPHVRVVFVKQLPFVVKLILQKPPVQSEALMDKCISNLLQSVRVSLTKADDQNQYYVVEAILKISTVEGIPEHVLLKLFQMTFFFCIRFESCVAHEAVLCGTEICIRNKIIPRNLLNWYKHDVLKLVIMLCVSIYLRSGTAINKALSNIAKMFGFVGPSEFISKHYKLIITMLLPWCIKYTKCVELLEEVASIIQKDLATALTNSFLTIYPYLFRYESEDVNNKCIEFVIEHTESSLYDLLNSDIKQTVAEILIHYHKNPQSVMLAFRKLLQRDDTTSIGELPHSKVAEYITNRFLGVLTFFEMCLVNPDFEKRLKYDVLLSLGEIMRFIGPKKITPFRFKILAMLKTALTIDDIESRKVCAKIWNIFIHTVDIQTLGPLLSTIVASLEQLLKTNADDVNAMFKFLIITNGSLLSLYIPDLYFIENMEVVTEEVKTFVKQQTDAIKKSEKEKFQFFLNQVKHENISVRIYGVNYLMKLFKKNRNDLNNLILERNNMNSMVENVIENLMIGCRHPDIHLQLASGKCLAELGAIEPSHLPPNYAPQRSFALNIHTDSFAIMALQELCRAYQFQKDTKYVDSFSLAIQEILIARGVCPKTRKKIEVWEAIPERMRQIMEPLLTSCYTGLKVNANVHVHPIFGSSKCQTCEEWAFIWASAMIEKIRDEDTQHLLNSFKPSIKRDTNMLAVFLPYILMHTLHSSSNEDCEKIFEEMHCVFESVAFLNNTSYAELNQTQSRIRGLKTLQFNALAQIRRSEEPTDNIGFKCAKLAFEQLDFLERWRREWRREYLGHTPDTGYQSVTNFLKRFDKNVIANANFNCGEYARALMYLEAYIEENSRDRFQANLSFLAKIYAELMDPDSLEGAIGLKTTELTLSEQILVNNMTERFLDSTACFEQLMQTGDVSPDNVRDIVQCYLRLDTPETALLVSEGIFNQLSEKYMSSVLKETQAEPLWRLGRFEELEKLLETTECRDSNNWGVQCGQALLSFRSDDVNGFETKIGGIYANILKMLRTGGVEHNAYYKGYPQVMKLHLLGEIEKAKHFSAELLESQNETRCLCVLGEFLSDWKMRLAILQPTPRIMEPVLCLRRILLTEVLEIVQKKSKPCTILRKSINEEIAKMWINSSELARNSKMFQQAQLCIMNAEKYKPEKLALEKAKLYWEKGDQTNCFKVIEQKLKEITNSTGESQSPDSLPMRTRMLYAETKFLQATYNAESMNISSDVNIQHFKDSLRANQKSEKTLVHLSQYIERMHSSMSEEEQNGKGREMLYEIMALYGKSMSYGCEFIYQSMPRMLSIWLDFSGNTRRDESSRKISLKMNEIVEKFSDQLPLFMFLTAFSQLVSRICHPSNEVYQVLKTIIVKLIQKFPQQSLWMILSVVKSSYANRVKRCMEIFNDKRLSHPQTQKLINDFNSLAEKLIELTNKEIPSSEKKPTVSSLVRQLPKLFEDIHFSKIIMPFEQYMQPILPPIGERNTSAATFDAFPNKAIYIKGIREEVTILMSLQKPRKVTLIGSDGKNYAVMMKPKDDLRKDFRLMEFNAVVKQYLRQDPEARQRRLYIRTYAVVPLNEECGLIEWVQNLHAFRQILIGLYKQQGSPMTVKELRAAACSVHDPIEKKRDAFLKVLLPRHPPVFGEWFKQRFSTPHNWYQARSSYIRTTAVMSIVGYILGLGDRHGENISFDGTNGDTVHVDFNCLFNKGEMFDYPERVPFRLTHNMVHAMGPLGTEGLFRKCCEITLRVLQAQTPTLMSILRPFVYDPLVTWSRSNKNDGNQERTDATAMANLRRIEERLKGFVKIKGRTSSMPLSTEGQVNYLISEATNIDNLAAMYIGWASFM